MSINLFGQPFAHGRVLGCETCPMDRVAGVQKVKGLERVRGRRAMLWVQSPGKQENERGLELVGPAGTLLWNALKPYGLARDHFDVQNVMRCYPVDDNGAEHAPTQRELRCCSPYNDEALRRNKSQAVVHLIMGDVAGEQLLSSDFRKDKPVMWYPLWDAYVVTAAHPSSLLYQKARPDSWAYKDWANRFRAVCAVLDYPGRWGYVKHQRYRKVVTLSELNVLHNYLRSAADSGRRVSVDIEDGWIDNKPAVLVIGFGAGKYVNLNDWRSWQGSCASVVINHPEVNYPASHKHAMIQGVKAIIEDPTIRKSLQNGSYDVNRLNRLMGMRMRGYDLQDGGYDTQYGTYLRFSFMRSFSLENQAYRFLPEFADYKEIVGEWKSNFALAPLDSLVTYNCADCDVTARLEAMFSPKVDPELIQIYINAAFTLDAMEKRGPLLDWPQWEEANRIIPVMLEQLDRALQQVSGRVDFNADSPEHVAWLVYDHLGLPQTDAGRSTRKEILQYLLAETGNPVLEMCMKRRTIGKIKSTYVAGYSASAKLHNDELRTIWWLTGAVTGRLRSGKGDNAEAQGIINFQNIHGNPLLQNMIVSDRNWRLALED